MLEAVVQDEDLRAQILARPERRTDAFTVADDRRLADKTLRQKPRLVAALFNVSEHALAVRRDDAPTFVRAPVAARQNARAPPLARERARSPLDQRRLARPARRDVADAYDGRADRLCFEKTGAVEAEARSHKRAVEHAERYECVRHKSSGRWSVAGGQWFSFDWPLAAGHRPLFEERREQLDGAR